MLEQIIGFWGCYAVAAGCLLRTSRTDHQKLLQEQLILPFGGRVSEITS